jgi:hypothetical protein
MVFLISSSLLAFQQFVARIPSPSTCYGVASPSVLEFPLAAVAFGVCDLVPATRPCLLSLELWRGHQSCFRCRLWARNYWSFWVLGRNTSLLVFRVKVLGLSPGAAPLPFLAGALHTLPGLGLSDDLCGGLPFHCGHGAASHSAYILNSYF